MFAIRCTRKLLNRGAPAVLEAPVAPTTLLGDWYANVVFTRPEQLVVCIAERTLLPVVVTAKDVKGLPGRVAAAAREMLSAVGIGPGHIAAEVEAMECGYLAVTANRRVLGSLNDFMFHFEHEYYAHPGLTLHERALSLAEMPCGAIEYAYPSEATRALFASAQAIRAAQSAA
jgi:hypothetical protein